MLLKKMLNDANLKNKNTNTYTRYIVQYQEGLERPVIVELQTNKTELTINIYDTNLVDLYSEEGLKKPEFMKRIINEALDNSDIWLTVNDKPITTLQSEIVSQEPVVFQIETQENYTRNGLGTLAMHFAQDYYAKRPENFKNIFADRRGFADTLVYENKVENKLGEFGDALAYFKAKYLGRRQDYAFVRNFLGKKNHFNVEQNPYSMPKRSLRKRGLINDELMNEQQKPDLMQIYGETRSSLINLSMFDCPSSDSI